MSDIIERLRAQKHHESEDCWYSCPESEGGCCNDSQTGCTCEAPLMHEAAKEIELLREQLDFWRNKELEKASKAMYAEMLKWSKQGYTVLQMQRDGENITFRPIA